MSHPVIRRRQRAWWAGFAVSVATLAFWVGLPVFAAVGPSPALLWGRIDARARAALVYGLVLALTYGLLRVIAAAVDLEERHGR